MDADAEEEDLVDRLQCPTEPLADRREFLTVLRDVVVVWDSGERGEGDTDGEGCATTEAAEGASLCGNTLCISLADTK